MQTKYDALAMHATLHTWHVSIRTMTAATGAAIMLSSFTGSLGCTGNDRILTLHRSQQDTASVKHVLLQQVRDWNRGDIDAFMQGYWQSPDLSFSSAGTITRGWQQTLDNYHARYADRQAMGRLAFSDLEMSALGPDELLVLGSWRLERDIPIGGVFTLIFRRISQQWRIVHDHTSAKQTNRPKP